MDTECNFDLYVRVSKTEDIPYPEKLFVNMNITVINSGKFVKRIFLQCSNQNMSEMGKGSEY